MEGIPAPPTPGPAALPGQPAAPFAAPGGAGAFTQIVAGVPTPPGPSAPFAAAARGPAPEAPADETPRRSPRLVILVLALALLGVAAVALILYFALK